MVTRFAAICSRGSRLNVEPLDALGRNREQARNADDPVVLAKGWWNLDRGILAGRGSRSSGIRLLDGVIVKNGPFVIARQSDVVLKDQDIIVVQAKASRLGMYLMGQAFFSAQLMRAFEPRSVESVALVLRDEKSCGRCSSNILVCACGVSRQWSKQTRGHFNGALALGIEDPALGSGTFAVITYLS